MFLFFTCSASIMIKALLRQCLPCSQSQLKLCCIPLWKLWIGETMCMYLCANRQGEQGTQRHAGRPGQAHGQKAKKLLSGQISCCLMRYLIGWYISSSSYGKDLKLWWPKTFAQHVLPVTTLSCPLVNKWIVWMLYCLFVLERKVCSIMGRHWLTNSVNSWQ